MLKLKEMFFFKKSKKTGTMSIRFTSKTERDLYINEIIYDADNTIEPVSFFAKDGSQLVSGSFFDLLKRQLHKIFEDAIKNGDIGIYKYNAVNNPDKLVEKM